MPPRKDRAALFDLPPIVEPADLPRATGAILHAPAAGELSPAEAADISKSVDAHVCAIEATDLHARKRASSAWRPHSVSGASAAGHASRSWPGSATSTEG